jgi:hypothetical protein
MILNDFFGLEELFVASNGDPYSFLIEMCDQIHNFNCGTGHANVVFAIGRSLKGRISTEERTIFGDDDNFDTYISPANHALHFYEFQLQSYRKAVDCWTTVGLRNNVVKDIRKMIGKMIWDAREEAKYGDEKSLVEKIEADLDLKSSSIGVFVEKHREFVFTQGDHLKQIKETLITKRFKFLPYY